MSWRSKETVSHLAVAESYELLKPDDRWVSEHNDGFTWWPGDLAQRVWSDPCLFQHGRSQYRVHAETDVVKGRAHLREEAIGMATKLAEGWLFAGIFDKKTESFSFATSLFLVDDVSLDLRQLFRAAVAMQVVEAYDFAKELVTETHAVRASTGHPIGGLRSMVDPHLHQVQNEMVQAGQAQSRWQDDDNDWTRTSWVMEREATNFETNRKSFITAVFEWEPSPGHVEARIDCEERHRRLGSGLFGTLTIPLRLGTEPAARLALEMNEAERSGNTRWQNMGSWCIHDGALAFRVFVPNWTYHENTLHEVAVSLAARAHWANEFFMEKKRQAMAPAAPSPEQQPSSGELL
jgi:hypothetical protein